MKKKILALLMSAALLCSLGLVGAHAATPEEDARALVAQTAELLHSGRYTLRVNYKGETYTEVRDGARWAADYPVYQTVQSMGLLDWFRGGQYFGLLNGRRARAVVSGDQAWLVLPQRRVYTAADPEYARLWSRFDGDGLTWPATEPAGAVFRAENRTEGLAACLTTEEPVYYPLTDETITYINTLEYVYAGGKLQTIRLIFDDDTDREGYPYVHTYTVQQLSPQPDESYFSTQWMLPLPRVLFHWFTPLLIPIV